MKTFYLYRLEDVHGNSGLGVVAEGVIFDTGMCAMTWLSKISTVTTFKSINDVKKLHSHGGRTQIVVEGIKRQRRTFDRCREAVREDLWIDRKDERLVKMEIIKKKNEKKKESK